MLFKSVLNSEEFYKHLKSVEAEELLRNVTKTEYAKDQVIFYEKTTPFGVYLLQSGRVKLYKTGNQGKNQIFQICTKGDFFGFHPVLQNSTYPDSASTLEACEVHFIPKQYFLKLIKNSPSISFYLLQKLSEEFRDFIDQETMLAQKPVRERVATVMYSLNDIYKDGADTATIPLSRQDLADLCGTVKETLVRELRIFKDAQVIASENGRDIEILDIEKLRKFCD
jgi:CRP-like cAMP-binding protein